MNYVLGIFTGVLLATFLFGLCRAAGRRVPKAPAPGVRKGGPKSLPEQIAAHQAAADAARKAWEKGAVAVRNLETSLAGARRNQTQREVAMIFQEALAKHKAAQWRCETEQTFNPKES